LSAFSFFTPTLVGAAGSKAFSPNPINVKVGGTVTWTNKDSQAHTVVSGTGSTDPNKGKVFDSGLTTLIQPGKTFSHTFTTAGTIPYFCEIHPTMVGTIIVT
jgi:plastocyanin